MLLALGFSQLLKSLHRLSKKNNLKTISIDELSNSDENYFEIPSKDLNPEDILIRKQRIQLLRRLVNQLPRKYMSVVQLDISKKSHTVKYQIS